MKKILFLSLLLCILTGCSSSITSDKKIVGTMTSEIDGQIFTGTVEVKYNSKTGEASSYLYKERYAGLLKNETNNNILANMISRQAILEEVKGVKVKLKATDTTFDYQEKWDYNEVDLKEVTEADETSSNFLEDDKFSTEKIKSYFENQGYVFKEKKIKK